MSSPSPNEDKLQVFAISDLAREFGVTPRTLRFYEAQGLVTPAREGRQRVYSRRDRTRLRLALRGKRLGLSLAEIKELINLYDTVGDDRLQLMRVLDVLARRKAALEQQREDIEAVLVEVNSFEAQCREILAGDLRTGGAVATEPGKDSKTG